MNPNDLEANLREALHVGYDVTREMPGGGMSRVFVATERSLNRTVVIKVLPPELAAGVNRERFQREIQLAAQLQHPHIVPLFSCGNCAVGDAREDGELLYYTMPYINGESLKHAIAEKTHFTVRDVVRILRDVSDALAYAHAHGVAHRDIKPGNILRSAGHAVVTDFGVAKALSAALPGVGMTTSGMAIGTPAYMAPEQLAGDPAADSRVDIYAVGLLAYELLLGESPFFSSSPQETMARQLTRDPEPISLRRADVPLPLAALISRCLAKAPEARPQTASQLVAELDALVTVSGDFTPRGAHKSRSTPVMVGVAAIVIIAGLSYFAWASSNNDAQTNAPAPVVVPAPVQLTHADSVAIAKAVDQKIAERRAADARADSIRRANAATESDRAKAAPQALDQKALARITDSLRNEMMHAVLDSVAKMQAASAPGRGISFGRGPGSVVNIGRIPVDSLKVTKPSSALSPEAFATRAANLGPARRLFVSVPRPVPGNAAANAALNMAASVIMDSLRGSLSHKPRYVVIQKDSVATALAITRTTDSIAKFMHAEMFASLTPQLNGGFVTWQLTLRDLTAHGAYSNRSVSVRVPADSMLAGTDSLIARAIRAFDEIDRAPRKAVQPPG